MSSGAGSSTRDQLRRQAGRAWSGIRLASRRVDPRPRALPDFVVVGAQKAGTSSLYGQLSAHPSVVPALRKEVHYFDAAPKPLPAYLAYFPRRATLDAVAARTGHAITGEATPFYLVHPAAPARMHAVLPDARLVAVLRDPVARAISGYHHAVRMGDETRPIEVALDPAAAEPLALDPAAAEPLAPPDAAAWFDAARCPVRLHGYLARGRYAEQLERWFAAFGRAQVLVLDSDALRSGRIPAEVLAFLGLPDAGAAAVPDRNVGAYGPPASSIEGTLRDYFRPHNDRLFSLLGVDWGWPR